MILNKKITNKRIYTFLVIVLISAVAFGAFQFRRAQQYQRFVSNQNSRTFYELVDYVENLEVSLAKAMLVSTPPTMEVMAAEIWREAAFAQSNLNQLPISHRELKNTLKFLNQVGDYSYSISKKLPYTNEIKEEEYDKFKELHEYSLTLSKELNNLRQEISQEKLTFKVLSKEGRQNLGEEDKKVSFEKMTNIQKEFQEYPSLIYDGPFSDHIENMSPRLLRNKEEITKEEAKKIAQEFLGNEASKGIRYSGEGNGRIKTYNFTVEKDEDTKITIDITKIGGYVLWMIDNTKIYEEKIKNEEAIKKAKEFLDKKGFKNMKESYYEENNNILTINFAYEYEDVIVYPDLMKVKVSLKDGKITGFESQGYLMSHEDKPNLPERKISLEEAKEMLNSRLKVTSSRLAVIPLESKKEVLCYEFKGKYNDRFFLVYINVESGKEEQILMLIQSKDGYLTI